MKNKPQKKKKTLKNFLEKSQENWTVGRKKKQDGKSNRSRQKNRT